MLLLQAKVQQHTSAQGSLVPCSWVGTLTLCDCLWRDVRIASCELRTSNSLMTASCASGSLCVSERVSVRTGAGVLDTLRYHVKLGNRK